MYGKNKGGVPSDAQSKEKLLVYVHEYLVHIGAPKAANSFLQEIHWDKSISVGEPPGFLYSWWSAAPERRDTHEHSSEAKAFHDYPNHPVMSGPGGVSGPGGGGPGMPPPLGPPGPEGVPMRQRSMMTGGGIPGSGPGMQNSPHHQSVRFHQPGSGGYPGIPVGGGMISHHGNLIPGSGPPHPMHGNPMISQHHHHPGAIVGHPRPRWVGPMPPQGQGGGPPMPTQQSGGPPIVCSNSVGPNSVSSTGPGSAGPGSCGGSGIVPSPGHPGTPNQHAPHLAVPSPINNQPPDHSGPGMPGHHHPTPPHYGQQPPQQKTPPASNACIPPEYSTRPSPHLVFAGGSTPDNGMFGSGHGCNDSNLLNGSVGPPRSGMMPPPPPDYGGMPSSTSGQYPPGSDLKASPLYTGSNMGCDMMSPSGGPPPLLPSDYQPNNGPGGNGPGSGFSGGPVESVMMMSLQSQQQNNMMQQQHMGGGPQGQAPPPPQYAPSGAQHSGTGGPSSMQSVCGGSNPSPSGGPGSVQFPQEYSFSQMS